MVVAMAVGALSEMHWPDRACWRHQAGAAAEKTTFMLQPEAVLHMQYSGIFWKASMTLSVVNFTVGVSTLIDLEENKLFKKDYCSSELFGGF